MNLTEQVIYRILDANLDRSREGLRVIEEWCRFGLNHAALTAECKQLRQTLAQLHTPQIRAARDTPNDPGVTLSHAQEQHRADVVHVLQANFCRIQEALRVLEEYGKIHSPSMGETCKQMRYRVYTLESQVLNHQRQIQLQRSHLYLVTSESDGLLETVEAALQGGLTLVQYRDKSSEDVVRMQLGHQLHQICQKYNALFIMNDRVDLAVAVDADGVHLGQQDIPIALARQVLGPQRLVGRSTTNPQEMQRALQEGADYIGVGPVYATPTKPGKAAAGLDYVRYAAQHCPIPWFAIGGINAENLPEVVTAGATRVAIVRAVMAAEQPTLVTQHLLSQLSSS